MPLLEEGKEWRVYSEYDKRDEREPFYSVYSVVRDTIINDEKCYIVGIRKEGDNSQIRYDILKETEKRIYHHRGSDKWYPLFDFSCGVGEKTIPMMFDSTEVEGRIVKKEEYILNCNKTYRCLYLPYDMIWVEGIGTLNDRFLTIDVVPTCEPLPTNTLKECYKDGELIFSYEEYKRTSSINKVFNDKEEEKEMVLYSLQGIKIDKPIPGTIYIRNGKKYITK